MKGNGVFIERHDFIQSITPMLPSCHGYVLLGRMIPSEEETKREMGEEDEEIVIESEEKKEKGEGKRRGDKSRRGDERTKETLELIAVRIPYGYTLLVEPQCIHGDSTLIGMYVMAMTGKHTAMGTADTVYCKESQHKKNVKVIFTEEEEAREINAKAFSVTSLPFSIRPILTSKEIPLRSVKEIDQTLKDVIQGTVRRESVFGQMANLVWRPIITTSSGWEKTLGTSLPPD